MVSFLFASEPADEGFHHKVEEEWGEGVSLEGASEECDVYGGAIWGEEGGGGILVEVRDNPAEVPWEADEEFQDSGELEVIRRRVGTLEVKVAEKDVLVMCVGVLDGED